MALFITFEGIEGCGKSTQLCLVAEQLRQQGYSVLTTREPGGCAIAEQIRALLLHPDHDILVPKAELLLYAAARAQHVEQIIRPALQQGQLVLCDRFCDATLAYQGYARQLEIAAIEHLNHYACSGLQPDLTFWLDLPVHIGLQRARQRNEDDALQHEQRFEQQDRQFHEQVRQGYLQLHQQQPERILRIDATGTVAEVTERIATLLSSRLHAAS
ncbi:MAG: dTMP kinase [Desulfuromonas sp.]|jgi:dTMP kinase|nr:dTMP kinase [Desulfuromonas thiophila]